jgi:plastocyanin
MRLKHVALVLGVAGLAACSDPYGTGSGGGTGGHLTTITVSSNFFTPTPDTVAAGTVTFSWSSGPHNVTWDSGPSTPANSGDKSSGTHAVTLVNGTYQYHCTIHGVPGSGMHGTIVVQ